MNPVSTDWLLPECQLHVNAAFPRLDNNESFTNCSASSWCMEMSATSGLMFHTAWQSVVLSSVIAEISPGIFIPIYITADSYLNTFSAWLYRVALIPLPLPLSSQYRWKSYILLAAPTTTQYKQGNKIPRAHGAVRYSRPLKKMRLVFIPSTGLCTSVVL